MILLDTHIWIWWLGESTRLGDAQRAAIEQADELCVSAISCWEIAKLVQLGRIELGPSVFDWLDAALSLPRMRLIELSPRIAAESAQLPGTFHRDPADQILVATARTLGCSLVTLDRKIIAYPHVETIGETIG